MNSVSMGIGTSAIQAGITRVERVAEQVAGANQFGGDSASPSLAESLIDLKTAQHQVQAGVKVTEAAMQNMGTIIDIMV